jgi:Pectate lyase superfamily protein
MTLVPDGVTDNTAALQAAINAAIASHSTLALPAGKILVKGPIVANGGNQPFGIVGQGPMVTQIIHDGSFGTALSLQNCANSYFANFGIVATAKMPSGANLSVSSAFRACFENLSLQEGSINLKLGNLTGATFRRIYTGGGTYFGGIVAGSYNLWLAQDPGGVNNGLDFDGCYWEGGGAGQAFYDQSIRIDSVDGAWFRGGHIYGAAHVQVFINGGPAVTAVLLDGAYIEHGATYGIIVMNLNGTVSGLTINACNFNGQPYPVALNGKPPAGSILTGNRGMGAVSWAGCVIANNL